MYIGEKDCWGKGCGTDATRVIRRYGFDRMRSHSIALWVVAENAAATRVYEKAGFSADGRRRHSFRRDGKWHDHLIMTLLEGEPTG
ncbi:GNAT family N-acetyltransferase [Planomonospora sp. ID91781]|nr:GNAT family N-acetyltransferase [Planomonospora sp. ID91781]